MLLLRTFPDFNILPSSKSAYVEGKAQAVFVLKTHSNHLRSMHGRITAK
jgi:hypothetical protein